MPIDDIRRKLTSRRDELEQRLRDIERDVRHEDNPLSGDWEEQAVQREHEEVTDALGNEARRELEQIKQALGRIDSGEYPYCSECGLEIGQPRLELLPYTSLCVACAQARESAN
jgi:RNA polymerase-binding protein DksA